MGAAGTAEGNGNPSNGRIAIRGAKNYLQLPLLPSVGKITVTANAGTDLKSFKLQEQNGSQFDDIAGTETECAKAIIKSFTFNINRSTPTLIRLVPTSGSVVYFWDIKVDAFTK